jgi:Icc protein
MLIAQISDLHIGFHPGDPDDYNLSRLKRVIDRLVQGPNRPDLMIVTGDLSEHGDPASYRRLADLFETCPFPVHAIVGNHDDRTSFSRAFPDVPTPAGFAQYEVALGGLRLLMLDTLEVGRDAGGFCDVRAAWLMARLDEAPEMPTVIAMHHPPFDIGIDWMRTVPHEPWVARFADAIAGHAQIRAIVTGHVHRPIVSQWRGVTVTTCPSTAPGLVVDLRPIDTDAPDHRAMVAGDAPGFTLHRWHGGEWVTFFDVAEDAAPLLRFDAKAQAMVRHLMNEQPPG